ncbi:MAG: universal stress protein [Candidatus Promineifilaceae bacterium]
MAWQKILVPLDGSELAERPLPAALMIAEAVTGQIVLLTAVTAEPFEEIVEPGPELRQRLVQAGQAEAKSYLKSVRNRLMPTPATLKTELASGPAAQAILDYAQSEDVDLIFMSSHGRSGVSRWAYGSVADKVLHHASCAVAIIRAQVKYESLAHKRILVPLDGSETAEAALIPALNLVKAIGGELLLLRVIDLPSIPDIRQLTGSSREQIIADEQHRADNYLQSVKQSFSQAQRPIATHVAVGPAAETIIAYADRQSVGLILISSHGRSGIGRWVFGRVTGKVLQAANCATLVIR